MVGTLREEDVTGRDDMRGYFWATNNVLPLDLEAGLHLCLFEEIHWAVLLMCPLFWIYIITYISELLGLGKVRDCI